MSGTTRNDAGEPPTVSVVVPTYGRAAILERCLHALAAQRYPAHRWEVVVVDDGSAVPVRPSTSLPCALRVIRQANAGPAAARNRGAACATGTLLAFTDDDCLPTPHWLSALVDTLRGAPGALVGGPVENVLYDDPYATATDALTRFLYDYHERRRSAHGFYMTSNLALRAESFRAVGGFDERFRHAAGEDREFSDRCRAAGHPLVFAPHALVQHAHALTLHGFARQHLRYGRSAPHYHRTRVLRSERAIPAEPLTFYAAMLSAPFRQRATHPVRTAALLALSQLCYATGYVLESVSGEGAS
ncbi:MAG: glycosyltransferase [Gemmatimonadaceae bacterium]|jgi:GT2 family glycosyltransferase|nr:glycosyltransferase [Gemmatimonadaceae bacterium]